MGNALVLLLGGLGHRFGGPIPKQFVLNDQGKPLFVQTLEVLYKKLACQLTVLVVAQKFLSNNLFSNPLNEMVIPSDMHIEIVPNGKTRHQSFRNGLEAISKVPNFNGQKIHSVLVHDANRPNLNDAFLSRVSKAMSQVSEKTPCLVPVVPVSDSILQTHDENVEYLHRSALRAVQTPQVLHYTSTVQALKNVSNDEFAFTNEGEFAFTDEGSFMQAAGFHVGTFEGDVSNTKITFVSDL